jgi:hypothetical protein
MKQSQLNPKLGKEFFTKLLKIWKQEKLFHALVNVGVKETNPVLV